LPAFGNAADADYSTLRTSNVLSPHVLLLLLQRATDLLNGVSPGQELTVTHLKIAEAGDLSDYGPHPCHSAADGTTEIT
jgi:hypothetical protein